MDSLRSKKVNKKPWIIGGCITAAVIILIIILCVTLGSSAESGTSVGVKDVYEAFAYIDNSIGATYKDEEGIRVTLLTDLRKLTEKVRVVEKMYKAKLEAEKNGQKYDISIIENQLLNAHFVEKDGKLEMVLEDKTKQVHTPPTDGKNKKAHPATPESKPKAAGETLHSPKKSDTFAKSPSATGDRYVPPTPPSNGPASSPVVGYVPPTPPSNGPASSPVVGYVPPTPPSEPKDGPKTEVPVKVPEPAVGADGTTTTKSGDGSAPVAPTGPGSPKPTGDGPDQTTPVKVTESSTPGNASPPSHCDSESDLKKKVNNETHEDTNKKEHTPTEVPTGTTTESSKDKVAHESQKSGDTKPKDGSHLQGSSPS